MDAEVSISSNFAGVVMRDCPQMKTGYAEIVLGTGGPLLVYQISHNDTRILVDMPKVPSDIKGYMLSVIEPQLPGVCVCECVCVCVCVCIMLDRY